jgi:hypothetical protein
MVFQKGKVDFLKSSLCYFLNLFKIAYRSTIFIAETLRGLMGDKTGNTKTHLHLHTVGLLAKEAICW